MKQDQFGASFLNNRPLQAKACAWLLMLVASLANLLNFNSYPLFRPEIAVIIAILAAAAVGAVLLEAMAERLAFVFTGILIYLGADLNSDSAVVSAVAALAALALAWFNNLATVKLAIAAFGTVTLFQVAEGVFASNANAAPVAAASRDSADEGETPPPLIHLLMDSHLGLEGMAADPAYRGIHDETIDFYMDRGFRLYGDAYSRHANTVNSVPYTLSFGRAKAAEVSQIAERQIPDRLEYFDALRSSGYKISVFGANFIDLCSGQPIDECRQFEHSELSAIEKFPMSTRDRAVSIGVALAGQSSTLSGLYDLWQLGAWHAFHRPPVPIRNLKKLAPPRSAVAMLELSQVLRRVEHGQAYFAHLLMPHEPYVFDERCRLLPRSTWSTEQGPALSSERHADYRAQLQCTHLLLGKVLDALESSEAGRDAIVIIHGDHGSRIVRERPTVERPSPDLGDFAMTYSTLFALRAEGIAPGVVKGRAALDDLLEEFTRTGFRTAPHTDNGPAEVVLATDEWVPRRRIALPKY